MLNFSIKRRFFRPIWYNRKKHACFIWQVMHFVWQQKVRSPASSWRLRNEMWVKKLLKVVPWIIVLEHAWKLLCSCWMWLVNAKISLASKRIAPSPSPEQQVLRRTNDIIVTDDINIIYLWNPSGHSRQMQFFTIEECFCPLDCFRP